MDHIDSQLATYALDPKLSPAIRAAAALGKKTVNKYYDYTDDTEIYRIATGESDSDVRVSYASQLTPPKSIQCCIPA